MRQGLAGLFLLLFSTAALAQDQQLGARTKAMGGSYTAFEDDPVSIWLNPAGIATQPDQMAIVYQTYAAYEAEVQFDSVPEVRAETALVDPAFLPAYFGMVFQLGEADSPMALGIAYARPYHIKYALDEFLWPGINLQPGPQALLEQSYTRFRVALAKDFRFRDVGEAGFLPHISIGLGGDVSYSKWEFNNVSQETFDPDEQRSITLTDNSMGIGGGAGLLVGLYDDTETFKVNLGLTYQSRVKYEFNFDRDQFPAYDMPQQFNGGVTFYLLRGTPLRLTFDMQVIDWPQTANEPMVLNQPGFDQAINFSVGAEYRIQVGEGIFVYPRVGYRRFDAPWADKDDLPMSGFYKLTLETEEEEFNIVTFGGGVSWISEGGSVHSLDVGADIGGDTFNVAVGFTREW